jgi:hypothetical protein
MIGQPKDLESVNDNLPVEEQLGIIRRWAEQMGYRVVAATLERALDEIALRSKTR